MRQSLNAIVPAALCARLGARGERFLVAVITLCAAGLRLLALDAKGLWYDEAATAYMSRPPVERIFSFHWEHGFEHLPLWNILMHFWIDLFGRSEIALRLPSAFAGILMVPLIWGIARSAWPEKRGMRLIAAAWTAAAPILVLYSQEARMYAIVALLAILSFHMAARLENAPKQIEVLGFIAVNVAMISFQYYSLLVVIGEMLYFAGRSISARRPLAAALAATLFSLAPFALWVAFSPGFHTTFDVVTRRPIQQDSGSLVFLDRVWRDFTFGSVVWQPQRAWLGYLLLPLMLAGGLALLRTDRGRRTAGRPGVLLVLAIFFPLVASLFLADRLATRYLLVVVPFCIVVMAAGVEMLWRWTRPLGLISAIAAVMVIILGLQHYYGPYIKSGYRDMAGFLKARASSRDAIVMVAPRQHFLARYYLPPDWQLYPIPAVPLPENAPVTAPPIRPAEVSEELRHLIGSRIKLWAIYTGQGEVDQGDFVPSFLAAIAFLENCWEWQDVRLCRYTSPNSVTPGLSMRLGVRFAGELDLEGAEATLDQSERDGDRVFVTLHWLAREKPRTDYKVTLRLLDRNGRSLAQADALPIGALLPPSTWQPGDRKPGYMLLPWSHSLSPGEYRVVVGVYDPADLRLRAASPPADPETRFVTLAHVDVDDKGKPGLLPPR